MGTLLWSPVFDYKHLLIRFSIVKELSRKYQKIQRADCCEISEQPFIFEDEMFRKKKLLFAHPLDRDIFMCALSSCPLTTCHS